MPASENEPPYHLLLHSEEIPVLTTALGLLVADEAHEAQIRGLAREVLSELERTPDERGSLTLALGSRQMKITHTALRTLYRDLGREQAEELQILRNVIDKLPDEHTMRAISLD